MKHIFYCLLLSIQLEWAKDGTLYLVDFGVVEFGDQGMTAHPFTGVVWRLKKK